MSFEILNLVKEESSLIDSSQKVNVKAMALAFASLDSLGNLAREYVIPTIYNAINTGFGAWVSDESARSLYIGNLKGGENSLIFPGYLGMDANVNSALSYITLLGGDGVPEFESVKCGVNALFCSASLNNLSVYQTRGLLDKAFNFYSKTYPSAASQLSDSGISDASIGSLLAQNYGLVLSGISQNSPKDDEVDIYSYSYFDTTGIFSQQVDYQRMGDSETQYYYISGKIVFDSVSSINKPCLKSQITGSDGAVTSFYNNLPCQDSAEAISPVGNLSFYRIFPDAPEVSGSEPLETVYKQFNLAASPELHNFHTKLFSNPALTHLYGSIISDLGVSDAIDTIETGQVPQAPNSTGYSSSHVGGRNSRWRITGYDHPSPNSWVPLYGLVPMTGFKIVPLSLDGSVWGTEYDALRTNPDVPLESKLIRALNIQDHLSSGNVGGPIVSSNSFELPCLYISENLYNRTVKTSQSGSIYFGTFSSSPEYDLLRPVIQGQLFTGISETGVAYNAGDTGSFPKITFSFPIYNTGFSGYGAEFAKRCFGMGDGGGELSFSGEQTGNNAGYAYRDFYVKSGGVIIPTDLFFQIAYDGILGKHESETIDYINGFTSNLPEETQKLYGYDETGGLIKYNYFQPGTYGSVVVPESGWAAPFPVLNSSLEPIIVSQARENYHPRYSKGPYSSLSTSFLYPTASGVNNLHPTGFPTEVEINITVSEEIARVYFQKRTLRYNLGVVEDIDGLPITNSIFNSDGTFKTSFKTASLISPDPSQEITVTSSEYPLVSDYWVNDQFYQRFDGVSSIRDLFTGQCVGSTTGIVKAGISLPITSGLILASSGDYPSGYYVVEYQAGYYQGVELPGTDQYRIQEAGDLGFYVSHSNKSGLKKLFPNETTKFPSAPVFASNPNQPFYHSGGAIIFSGAFPTLGSLFRDRVPQLTVRLEKDCSLAAPFYFTYGGSDIDAAGFKYLTNSQCLSFIVYPTGTSSINGVHKSVAPYFIQGVRTYHKTEQGCVLTPSLVPYYELLKKGTGVNTQYSEMPKYDTNPEFHIKNAKNRTLTLKYTLPSFRLQDRYSHPEYADDSLQIPDVPICTSPGVITDSPISLISSSEVSRLFNDGNKLIPDGVDPIWFQVVGGNTGISGGYHSKGIIGDSWIGMLADVYGIRLDGCTPPIHYLRNPELDNFVLEANLKPGTETSLHTRALTCTPGYFDKRDDANGFQFFDLTGLERAHIIPNASYNLLAVPGISIATGFQEYFHESSEYLFPQPNDYGPLYWTAFDTLSKYPDPLNPGEYKSSGVVNYWKKYLLDPAHISNGTIITGFRYRDKSRINFSVNSIKITKFGGQPIDLDQDIRLTGKCLVSGEFAYHSQAESAVFSEGVFLKDHSANYPLADFYAPSFVSDVLLRLPLVDSGSITSPIDAAPSRCVTRKDISRIRISGNEYIPHLSQSPYNYNKFIVPVLSDLSYLNEENDSVGFEKILEDDGAIFPNTSFLINATVAQHKGTNYEQFLNIPDAPKVYYVQDIKQFFDSSVTDAALNSGYFITTGRGTKSTLEQRGDLTGFIGPENAKYSLYKLGLYQASGYPDYNL